MTRRSAQEAVKTRAALVDAAARLFRKKGLGAVSIAEIMGEVGMTVGGFYKHFENKDALVHEAIAAASKSTARELRSVADDSTTPAGRLSAVVDRYLSPSHRDHPESGCPIAALATDGAHAGPATRKELESALHRLIEVVGVTDVDIETDPRKLRRKGRVKEGDLPHLTALRVVVALVGAVVLARTVNDRELKETITTVAREMIDIHSRGL